MERRNTGTTNNNGDQNRRHGGATYINNTRISVSSSTVFFLPGPGSFDISLRQGQLPPLDLDSQRSEQRREQAREQRREQTQVQQMRSDLQHNRRVTGSVGYSPQQSRLPSSAQLNMSREFAPSPRATPDRVMTSPSSTPSTPLAPVSPRPNPCYTYGEDEELVLPDGFTLSQSDC